MKYKKALLIYFVLFIWNIDCATTYAQNMENGSYYSIFRSYIGLLGQSNYPKVKELCKLDPRDIATTTKSIWEDWKRANKALTDTIELPDPNPNTANILSWVLPNEAPLPFYFLTKGNRPLNGYPLFISLHGSGPKEKEWPMAIKLAAYYRDGANCYFIPQIPSEERYRWWYKPQQYAWQKLFRLSMLNENFNTNQIYFIGISEGAYGSQRLGAFFSDYLAGAGCMAGGEPLLNAPVLNFRNIAFALETGEFDSGFGRNRLTLAAKKVFDSLAYLNPNNFRHQINLQVGRGHGIDYKKVSPWLVNYTRNSQPKKVSWVNFPLDGSYRLGFYNIGIAEQPNISETSEFDRSLAYLDIEDNIIRLTFSLCNADLNKTIPIKKGVVDIFLSDRLVNLKRKVKLFYNGKMVFYRKPAIRKSTLAQSCALFGDPERLFPAKITLYLKDGKAR